MSLQLDRRVLPLNSHIRPMQRASDPVTKCPICGGPAEPGYLCAPTEGLALRWIVGQPSMLKTFRAMFGKGLRVGTTGMTSGTYVVGTHCSNCRKIVLGI